MKVQAVPGGSQEVFKKLRTSFFMYRRYRFAQHLPITQRITPYGRDSPFSFIIHYTHQQALTPNSSSLNNNIIKFLG